jgi:G-patch domain
MHFFCFQKKELDKFLKNADTIVSGLKVEKESDYEDKKILSDNIGFQMLKRAGWSEGGGLGDVGKLTMLCYFTYTL